MYISCFSFKAPTRIQFRISCFSLKCCHDLLSCFNEFHHRAHKDLPCMSRAFSTPPQHIFSFVFLQHAQAFVAHLMHFFSHHPNRIYCTFRASHAHHSQYSIFVRLLTPRPQGSLAHFTHVFHTTETGCTAHFEHLLYTIHKIVSSIS